MAGTVYLGETALQVSETAGVASQRIVRTGPLDGEVTITYGVTADTATEGQDFVGGTGTITMPAGVSEIAVPVQILDDAVGEPTETLVFSLINAGGATLWAPRTSRISVIDDETPPPPADPEPPPVPAYDVRQVPVVGGLNQPIRMEFSPLDPSQAFVAEKEGVIRIADLTTGTSTVFLDISDRVNKYADRGLMDIALHPDFANNPYVYAFFTVDPPGTAGLSDAAGPDGNGNRYSQVVRFTADAATGFKTAVPGSEVVLLGKGGQSLDDISGGGRLDFTDPAYAGEIASDRHIAEGTAPLVVGGFKQDYLKVDSASHAGADLAFGPGGALYVSTGEGTAFDFADPRAPDVQSLDSLSGKILRVDPMTGQGLADNPFVTPEVALDSNRAKVFQLGLRNPFSMTFDPEGRLFIADTGWNSYEEINSGGPGANFGWPFYEGGDGGALAQTPGYRDLPSAAAFYAGVAAGAIDVTPAFRAFSHDDGDPGFQVQTITGSAVVYTGDAYPAALRNDFIFADFNGEVYSVDVNDPADVKFLYQTDGSNAPVDFRQGADGLVYYVDIGAGEIGRLDVTPIA
jgi:glucose/arabinose dehydrogenase